MRNSKLMAQAAKILKWTKPQPIDAASSDAAEPMLFTAGTADIVATESEGDRPRSSKVEILAYNGGPLVVAGYNHPVYLDLAGMSGFGRQLPLLREHNRGSIIGTVTSQAAGGEITATGKLVGDSEARREVEALAADGYAWQASVGVRPQEMKFVKAGHTMSVNGQAVIGPAYVATRSRLAEVSIVTIGADAETQVAMAVAAADPGDADQADSSGDAGEFTRLAEIKAEDARRKAIEAAATRLIRDGGAIDEIEAAMNEAITAGVTANQFELELLRKYQRPQGRITSGSGRELTGRDLQRAVEASVLMHLGHSASELEAQFPEQTLAAMDRHRELRHGLSLQDLLCMAAEHNGHRVNRRDITAMLRGAFPVVEASGISSIDVGGILSNVANKFLKASFDAVEAAWREIAEIEPVNDFKAITSYSLTGDMTYAKVSPGGELKSATLGEATYTNQAETYGRIMGIDRRDIVNDDLGAFRNVTRRLGRGGALALNDVFWAEFLADHASFFTAGNGNLIGTGSSAPWYLLVNPADLAMIQVVFLNGRQTPTVEQADADFKQLGIQMRGYYDFGVNKQEHRAAVKSPAALDLAALEAADLLLRNQTDHDGKPLALMPTILLTSNSNAVKAREIYNSTLVVGPSGAKTPNANVFAGMFKPVSSSYLPNA